ncbi:MAG: hypothetical protein ACE366_16790 [Bradymonadia bacterium]
MDRDTSPQDKCGLEAHVDIEDLKHMPELARDAMHEFDNYVRAAAIVMRPPTMAEQMIRRSIEASIYVYGAVFTMQENAKLREELAFKEKQRELSTKRVERALAPRRLTPPAGLGRHRISRV